MATTRARKSSSSSHASSSSSSSQSVLRRGTTDCSVIDLVLFQSPAHRHRRYTDATKPRPLCRGILHGLESLALCVAIAMLWTPNRLLALALLGKLINVGASAAFHLYPYKTMFAETMAYRVDTAAVPCSAVASVLPFLDYTEASTSWELGLAVAVLLANTLAIIWQTHGQEGLKPLPGRSDTARSVVVTLYSLRVIGLIGLATGFSRLWAVFFGSALLMGLLTNPVNSAHEEEPTASWAFWHVRGVYSFHEDFHISLLVTDLLWLMLALRALSSDGV